MMDQAHAEELFLQVLTFPQDDERKQALAEAFDKDPATVFKAVEAVGQANKMQKPVLHAMMASSAVKTWKNCIGQQQCRPARWFEPQSLQELVDIVTQAAPNKVPVRAVGSGHSFSDITNSEGAYLIDPHSGLANAVAVDAAVLKDSAEPATLFRVQCGITVKDLNLALDKANLALIDMGAYDGQTVSGALSTGTHGSGAAYGPMASFLQSIVLVTETGTVYQVEPANGITDPAKFSGKLPESDVPVTLKQDDDYFHAAQVAMGCLGIIYSYTLRVCPAFSLSETRTLSTWEEVKKPLEDPSAWNPLQVLPGPLKDIDHYEIMVNPYLDPSGSGRHSCIEVKRTRIPKTQPRGARHNCINQFLEDISVKNSWAVVLLLNTIPSISPRVINGALKFLQDDDPPYVDVSHNVFTLGIENTMPALALELHFDAVNCVKTIDHVLDTFKNIASETGWYLAGPIGIRFIAASDAFLAPESGRLTCTAELDMLAGITSGTELLAKVKAALCGKDSPVGNASVRIHWGLDLDFTTADDVKKWYPNLDKWKAVYRDLNKTGMFDNKFTKRIQLRD